MKKTRIIGRIIAGAVASAVLLTGALAAPAQAKDSGWGTTSVTKAGGQMSQLKDSGWGTV